MGLSFLGVHINDESSHQRSPGRLTWLFMCTARCVGVDMAVRDGSMRIVSHLIQNSDLKARLPFPTTGECCHVM